MRRFAPILLTAATLFLGAAPLLAQDEPPAPPEAAPEPAPAPAPDEDPGEAPGAPDLNGVDYFPLEAGRRWTYRVAFVIEPVGGKPGGQRAETGDSGEHRMDVYVAEALKIDDRMVAALEWKLDQDLAQRSYFLVSDGYLRCVKRLQGFAEHVKEFTLSPPQPVVPVKVEVGQKWTWKGKAGAGPGKQTFQVLREESVESPAGTFQTLVVQAVFEGEDDSRGVMTRWLAAGVGIVREVSEVRTSLQVFRTEGILVKYEAP